LNVENLVELIEKKYNQRVMEYCLEDFTLYLVCAYRPWIMDNVYKLVKDELTKKHPPEAGVFGGAKHPLKLNKLITRDLNDYASLEKRLKVLENQDYRDVYINNYGDKIKEIVYNGDTYNIHKISPIENVGVFIKDNL